MTDFASSVSSLTIFRSYRLGAFGFLYSEDLQKAGIKANRGLHDQRVALLWIRENIRGFGGDPDQISIVGESAGGGNVPFQPFCWQYLLIALDDSFLHPSSPIGRASVQPAYGNGG